MYEPFDGTSSFCLANLLAFEAPSKCTYVHVWWSSRTLFFKINGVTATKQSPASLTFCNRRGRVLWRFAVDEEGVIVCRIFENACICNTSS